MDDDRCQGEVKGTVSCDIWEALRKFANENTTLVAAILKSRGPMTLGELRNETNISTNVLNHNLIEMRRVGLLKKIGSKYYLTKYGAVIFDGLGQVMQKLHPIPQDALFEPVEQTP